MPVTRRRALGLLGATLAYPYVLRPDRAAAAAAATLTRLGNPIFLGAGQPGGKFKVALSAFPTGNRGFIAGWLNYRGGVDFRAFIRYFDSLGTPISPEIQMGPPTGQTDGIPASSIFPIANPDGSALILFGAARDGIPPVSAMDVFGQRMSAVRQKIGNPYRINSKTAYDQTSVSGTRLSTDNYMVAWQHTGTTLDSFDVRDRIIGFSGTPITDDQRAHPEFPGVQTPRSITALANGQSVISYSSLANGIWRLRAAVVALDGTLSGPPIVIKSVADDAQLGSAGVTGLGGSDWTAVWYAARDPGLARLTVRTFSGTAPTTSHLGLFDIRCGEDAYDHPPNLVPIAQSDRVFCNYRALNSSGDLTVQGRVFKAGTGAVLTTPIVVRNSPSGLDPINEALIRLSSQFFIAGFSEGDGNLQNSKAGIQRIEFDPGP